MELRLGQWLQLILRWVHIFAGIMWVGTTYFFAWLEGQFAQMAGSKGAGKEGDSVWMVHSGEFYRVDTQKVIGGKPHWFGWASVITWLSGVTLLILVYYEGGLMVELVGPHIRGGTAAWLSMGLLAASWPVYNLLLFRLIKNEIAGVVVSFALVAGLSYFLTRVFTGRAAYLQVGGMFGTIMASNVWMSILPAQTRIVAALKAGETPDPAEARKAKACSKHNTFLAVAVVFTMISNHFPSITYGQRHNWVVLSVMVLLGWGAAKIIRRS